MEFLSYELSNVKLPGHPSSGENTLLHRSKHPFRETVRCNTDGSSSTNRDRERQLAVAAGSVTTRSGFEQVPTSHFGVPASSRPLRNRAARWFIQHVVGRHQVNRKLRNLDVLDGSDSDRGLPSDAALRITSEDIQRNRALSRRCTLNVGGEHHEVLWTTLERIPNSRLGRLSRSCNPREIFQLCDEYVPEKNEFYFDRPARSFSAVLGLYRTGHLHIVDDVCVLALKDDLNYWGISEHLMDACCLHRYYQKKEQMEDEIKKTNEICLHQTQEEQFGTGKLASFRRRIWDLVEKPQTSMAARVFAVISITFILLSIIGLNLSTIPELRVNVTHTNDTPHSLVHDDSHLVINPKLETLELVCTIWFTFELLVRFTVTPNKWTFAKSPMNLIDVIAILPFYFSKIFEFWLNSTVESLVSVRKVVQMFRILRILRVFKLARHSQGLQALGYTLAHSYKELGLLMTFVMLVVLLFSSLAYFAEKDDNEMFSSIPATFWWAIITMTTVGYGDITPRTILGKVIGSVCCICGVMVIGLPIPIIVNNFAAFYQEQTRREKVMKHQEATKKLCLEDGLYERPSADRSEVISPGPSEDRSNLLLENPASNASVSTPPPNAPPASSSSPSLPPASSPPPPPPSVEDSPKLSSMPLLPCSASSHEMASTSTELINQSDIRSESNFGPPDGLIDLRQDIGPLSDMIQERPKPNADPTLSDNLPLLIVDEKLQTR